MTPRFAEQARWRTTGVGNRLMFFGPNFADLITGNIIDRGISFRSLNPANQERGDERTRDDVAGSDVVARGAFVRDDAAVACGEAGFKTVLSDNWYGLIGPADLPAEVEARLRNAAISTLRSAELKKQFDTQDAVPSPSTPEEFAAFVKGERAKWEPVVSAVGIKLD